MDLTKLKEYGDVVKQAAACLEAQWFGIGKPEEQCGVCIFCVGVRLALTILIIGVFFLIMPRITVLAILSWAAWSLYTGRGWLGASGVGSVIRQLLKA